MHEYVFTNLNGDCKLKIKEGSYLTNFPTCYLICSYAYYLQFAVRLFQAKCNYLATLFLTSILNTQMRETEAAILIFS